MDISSNLKFKNLEIIEDPKNVNFINKVMVPHKGTLTGLGGALQAGLVGAEKTIEITEPKGAFTFPFEPLHQLQREVGRFYMSNFAMIDDDCCVNAMNFNGFEFVADEEDRKFTSIIVNFKDGYSWYMKGVRNSAFITGEKKRLEKLQEDIFAHQKTQEELKDLAKQRTKDACLPDGAFAGVETNAEVEEHEDYLSKIQADAETFNAEMEEGETFDNGELHIECGGMETFE